MDQTAFVRLLDSPKLISRKIWLTEKSWIIHTVQNLQTSLKVQPIKVNKALKSLGKKLEISNLA